MAKTNFIALTNRKRKFKGNTRHYTSRCWLCGVKRKNINYHYEMFHPEKWQELQSNFGKALSKGYMGQINGFRFIKTQYVKKR